MFYLLRAIDSNGEDEHKDDTSKETVLIVKGLGDSQKPLHSNYAQPHHGHGDGDVLDWVGDVRNDSVVPLFLAHGNATITLSMKNIRIKKESTNAKTFKYGWKWRNMFDLRFCNRLKTKMKVIVNNSFQNRD